MKRLILGFLLFLNIGCNKNLIPEHTNQLSIDARLMSYVETFKTEYKSRLNKDLVIQDLIIQIAPIEDSVIGNCKSYINDTPVITINQNYYNYYMHDSKFSDLEQVVFHELGHCILNIHNHHDQVNEYGTPMSIMNKYQIYTYYYDLFRQNYLDRLFLNKF